MPDTSTEVALATTTLSSAAASITFSSISSAYTDLRVVFLHRNNQGSNDSYYELTFNNDSTALYSQTVLDGNGTSARSARGTGQTAIYGFYYNPTISAGIFAISTIDIFSYAGSTNKTVLLTNAGDNNGSGGVDRGVGLYRSTTAISSIKLLTPGTFNAGTTATLYGIL